MIDADYVAVDFEVHDDGDGALAVTSACDGAAAVMTGHVVVSSASVCG